MCVVGAGRRARVARASCARKRQRREDGRPGGQASVCNGVECTISALWGGGAAPASLGDAAAAHTSGTRPTPPLHPSPIIIVLFLFFAALMAVFRQTP